MPAGKYQLEVQRLGRTDYRRVILSSVRFAPNICPPKAKVTRSNRVGCAKFCLLYKVNNNLD